VRIGIPTEVKNNEYRVGITPVGVHELVRHGHEVLIQAGAGLGSSIPDDDYVAQGARILTEADDVWAQAEMVMKVKEPVEEEYHRLREDLTLFTYLHLAAEEPLTRELVKARTTAIAYETVRLPNGLLPLLYPMSEVAGCLAPQVGAHSLMKANGGRGVLMGGVGGVASAKVVVLGGGVAGQNAANIATLAVQQQVLEADMVIGSVLVPGARAPKLVTNDMVASMKPGSVLVDIAVDQGGCFEDTHPTTHADPTFRVHESTFYCVANMPGSVPNTSTWALTNATLPYAVHLANKGWQQALRDDAALAEGLSTHAGEVIYAPVADAHGLEHRDLAEVLA